MLGLGELDDEWLPCEPGHGSWRVRQAGRDEVRVVSAFVEFDKHAMLFNGDSRGDIQEVSEDLLGLGAGVFAPDPLGHEAVEGTGDESDLQIEVDLEANHGRERVDMEELNGFGNSVLDEHSLSVARDQGRAADFEIVGE